MGVISREVSSEGGKRKKKKERRKEGLKSPPTVRGLGQGLHHFCERLQARRAAVGRSRSPSAHPSCSCSLACSSSEGAPKICVVASGFCLKMNSVCESDPYDEGVLLSEQPEAKEKIVQMLMVQQYG